MLTIVEMVTLGFANNAEIPNVAWLLYLDEITITGQEFFF